MTLKQIKRELGGTVNDVVLAATAGGLRRFFEHRGRGHRTRRASGRWFRSACVEASEALALGNRVTSLFVELPVAEPDPLLRYRRPSRRRRG